MVSKDEVRAELFQKIYEAAETFERPEDLLALAEAFAWLSSPSQPHGGSTVTSD